MIRHETQPEAPHLLLEMEGTVSGGEVRRELTSLPEELSGLPEAFVMLALYPNVTFFKADAVGPLFYFVTHIFDAEPGLCVFVDGGRSPHPGLRAFIEQIGLDDQVAFVQTRAEADTRIEQHLRARG